MNCVNEYEVRRLMNAIERSEGSGCVWVVLFLVVVYGCETRRRVNALIESSKPVVVEIEQQEEHDDGTARAIHPAEVFPLPRDE
jgi:hypothetical protein